jgi:hypothetical protein
MRYVEGFPEPQTFQQKAGTDGHFQVEHYLKTGEDVLGPMMRSGKHFLPMPGPDLLVEQDFGGLLTAAGVPLVGYMDIVNPTGKYVSPEGLLLDDPKGTVEIADNKTTSNINYAKKGDELITTTQMVGYAEWARRKFPWMEHARLSHIYFQSKKPHTALKATSIFPIETISKRWQEVEAVVERMKGVAKVDSWEEVEGNPDACTAYKGCPFRNRCFKSPLERINVSLLAKVRSMNAAGANGAVVAPPAPEASPQPPSPAPEKKRLVIQDVPAPAPSKPAIVGNQPAAFPVPWATSAGSSPVAVVPPDAPKTQQASPATPAAPAATQAPVTETAARKIGRPRKTEATSSAVVAGATNEALAPFRLYVNAVPNGGFVTLDAYIAEVVKEIEAQFKVPDIRCAPDGNSPLAYAKWKGVLAALVKAKPPVAGSYVIFTRGNEFAEVVAEALSGLCTAGALVRGV